MNNLDSQLKKLYTEILENGRDKDDRTGVGTRAIFGHMMKFRMDDGFPLTTLRKIHTKSLIHELLWFLSAYDEKYKKYGNTNIRYLLDHGVRFWTEWAYENYKKNYKGTVKDIRAFEEEIKADDRFALEWGDLGPVYGKQWTKWGVGESRYPEGINQIDKVIKTLKEDPDSRRLIVNAWNVAELDEMALTPCHFYFQVYTENMTHVERVRYAESEGLLLSGLSEDEQIEKMKGMPSRQVSLLFNARSNDTYLGQPFNIASYAILLHMIGKVCNMKPDVLVYTGGDVHLYKNSIEATTVIMEREPRELPVLKIPAKNSIYDYRYEDIVITGYDPHPNIKVEVAV